MPALQAALARAERGAAFARSPLLRRVLRYLVSAACAGDGNALTAQRVARAAFGKPADFDPAVNASVRTEMARLRRLLARQRQHEPHLPGIDIARGSYLPRLTEPLLASRGASAGPDDHGTRAPGSAPHLPPGSPLPGPGVLVFGLAHELPDAQRSLAFGLMRQLFAELSRHRYLYLVDALDHDPRAVGSLADAIERHGCQYALYGEAWPTAANPEAHADGRTEVRLWLYHAANHTTPWHGTFELAPPPVSVAACGDAGTIAARVATTLGATLGIITRSSTAAGRPSLAGDRQADADALMTMHFNLHAAGEYRPGMHAELQQWARRRVTATPWCAQGWYMLGALRRDAYLERLDPAARREATLAEAEQCLLRALALDPALASAAFALATVRHATGDAAGFRHWLARSLALQGEHPEHAVQGGSLLCLAGDQRAGAALIARANPGPHPAPAHDLARAMAAWAAGNVEAARAAIAQVPKANTRWRTLLARAIVLSAAGDLATASAAWAGAQAALGAMTGAPDAQALQSGMRLALEEWLTDPRLARRAWASVARLAHVTEKATEDA